MSAPAAELRRVTDLIDAFNQDEIHHHLDVLTLLQQIGALPC